jgi:ABC-type transport system involved in cytochrome c biogenesis permease subunit
MNSNKTNMVFVNNGVLNSIHPPPAPPPRLSIYLHTSAAVGRVLTNYVALLWGGVGQPWLKPWHGTKKTKGKIVYDILYLDVINICRPLLPI